MIVLYVLLGFYLIRVFSKEARTDIKWLLYLENKQQGAQKRVQKTRWCIVVQEGSTSNSDKRIEPQTFDAHVTETSLIYLSGKFVEPIKNPIILSTLSTELLTANLVSSDLHL